jgi:CBS domain-containing protein
MKVHEVMTDRPHVVRPEATLQEAASMMQVMDVGPLPVSDDEGRLVGMITDRDITVRGTAVGRAPDTAKVRDVMSADVAYVYEDQSVKEAARVMRQRQIRRLPVLNRSRRLVGIISLADIALSDVDEDLTAGTLEEISKPGASGYGR